MTGYTMTAHPTLFQGRMYRSRLEAKWAAFFYLSAWPAEYEPFDLGTWSPDFILHGHYGIDVLVEVKPTPLIDDRLRAKMVNAVRRGNMRTKVDLLLLGSSPEVKVQEYGLCLGTGFAPPGDSEYDPRDREKWSVRHAMFMVMGRGLSCHAGGYAGSRCFPTSATWDAACNLVQWRPGR